MRGKFLLQVAVIAAVLTFIAIAVTIRAKRPSEPAGAASVRQTSKQTTDRSNAPARSDQQASNPSTSAGEVAGSPSGMPSSGPVSASRRTTAEIDGQAKALHEAALLGLIQNAQVAEQKGDAVTRDAMLKGLKKEAERAKELVKREMAKGQDSAVSNALGRILERLE